ncbi:MAG TPA: GAF domain-containing protein [Oscillatoriales cyanobacterium M59_W2019_021]|nr:GAF domain-containing protein [Oscillatoriales cyanobacterium M4454_W2019_049]HIK52448.1 GAF domain-containing protein [Oscillatoriales cyanobacterium M59_W2019_021]
MQPSVDPAQVGQQITQILVNNLESDTLLSEIAGVLTQAFAAGGTSIAIREERKFAIRAVAWHPQHRSETHANPPPLWDCPAFRRQLARTRPLAIADLNPIKMNAKVAASCREANVRSVLAIETRSQGEISGAIAVMKSQPYEWTDDEIAALQAGADLVAIAIAQVRQATSIRILEKQTGTFTHQQALLARLTKAILNSLDLTEVLQEAIEGITQTLQASHGLVLLFKYPDDRRGDWQLSRWGIWDRPHLDETSPPVENPEAIAPQIQVTVVAQWRPNKTLTEDQRANAPGKIENPNQFDQAFKMSDCAWCQQAYRWAPQPLAIGNRRKWLDAHPKTEIAPIFQSEATAAALLVPLTRSNDRASHSPKILGFLVLQHDRPREWEAEELKLVELVGTQLGNALLQTRILHQVHSLVGDRTAQLQRSMDVQAKLYEQSRRQVHQLRSLHQQTSEFLAAVSHELNTPLTSMGVAIEMLRQVGLTPERQATYLNILEQEWRREKKLVENLLMLQRLEAKETALQMQAVDLPALLRELGEAFEQKWAHKKLKLAIDLPRSGLKLKSDAESLKNILEELLTNAGKYSHPGTTAIFQVIECVEGDIPQVEIALINFGSEIPPEDLPHIFDPFRRRQGATQEAIPGTGLGLALVRGLVQLLYGEIGVSCQMLDDKNTSEIRFTLTLPQNIENPS